MADSLESIIAEMFEESSRQSHELKANWLFEHFAKRLVALGLEVS